MRAFRSACVIDENTGFAAIVKAVAEKTCLKKAMREWFQSPYYPAMFSSTTAEIWLESYDNRYALKLVLPKEKQTENVVMADGMVVIEVHQKTPNWLPLERPRILSALIDNRIIPETEKPFARHDMKPMAVDDDTVYDILPYLKGEKSFRMPFVYLSASKYTGKPVVDPESLQAMLLGQAHVVYEEGKTVNGILWKEMMREDGKAMNPYNGAAAIVVSPKNQTKFNLGMYTDPNEAIPALVRRLQEHVAVERAWKLYNYPALRNARIAHENRELSEENGRLDREIADLRANVKDKSDEEITELFDELVKRYETERAQRKVAEDDAERWKTAFMRKAEEDGNEDAVTLKVPLPEFYPGELKDSLIRIAERAKDGLTPQGRLVEVVNAIVKENDLTGIGKDFEKTVKETLSDAVGMPESRRKKLSSLGLDIELRGSDHWMISVPGHPRYCWTMANTPSDQRSGLNAAGNIIRTLLK